MVLRKKQVEVFGKFGFPQLIDEDCTNKQIDLEECIVRNNRYAPCAPPKHDLKKYNKLYEKRLNEFIEILKSHGYKGRHIPDHYSDTGLEIDNFDDKYYGHVEAFQNEFNKSNEKLSQPFEGFLQDFDNLKNKLMKNLTTNFNSFEVSLTEAACKKEISVLTVESFDSQISAIQDMLTATHKVFEKTKLSLQEFLKQLPQKAQKKCKNKVMSQENVSQKLKVIKSLNWSCDSRRFGFYG